MSGPLRTIRRAMLRVRGLGGSARIRRRLTAARLHAERQKALTVGLHASRQPERRETVGSRLKRLLRRAVS